jgi:general secretion pathway protein B
MSYILDALRKSEQQRQRGATPLMFTTQISSNVEKKPVTLLYGLFAIILICVGILIGWLRPWQQIEKKPINDAVPIAQHEEKIPTIKTIKQPLLLDPEKPRKSEMEIHAEKSILKENPTVGAERMNNVVVTPPKVELPSHKSLSSTTLPKVRKLNVEDLSKDKLILPPIELHGIDDLSETSSSHKIVALTELPLSIQQEIPIMTISGYAYSTIPKERIVGINDRLLQEGDYLVPGLRLEQIVTDGLVFSYKKYLFRHSL